MWCCRSRRDVSMLTSEDEGSALEHAAVTLKDVKRRTELDEQVSTTPPN